MRNIIETRYGSMECLQNDTVVSRSLALYGEWAQDELVLLQRFLRPGDVALDVGAFIGTHTLALARAVGAYGAVHSFEPRATIREILASNVSRNELQQVSIHDFALGDSSHELNIIAVDIHNSRNFGGLAIEDSGDVAQFDTEIIHVKMLDALALPRIDLIKIDAEGMEVEVLLGGRESIAKHQPVIFAECNDLQQGSGTWKAMKEHGYDVYGFLSRAFNPDNLRKETSNIFGEATEVSLLGIPPGRRSLEPLDFDLQTLAAVQSLDDLALLMLHKPQYPDEVWRGTNAGVVLGLNFESPRARKLQESIDTSNAELKALSDKLKSALDHSEALQQASRREIEKLRSINFDQQRQISELKEYRATSVVYLWHRLSGSVR